MSVIKRRLLMRRLTSEGHLDVKIPSISFTRTACCLCNNGSASYYQDNQGRLSYARRVKWKPDVHSPVALFTFVLPTPAHVVTDNSLLL